MPVVPRADGANGPISVHSEEEQLRLHSQLGDGDLRRVPWRIIRKGLLPQGFGPIKMFGGGDIEFCQCSSPSHFKPKQVLSAAAALMP